MRAALGASVALFLFGACNSPTVESEAPAEVVATSPAQLRDKPALTATPSGTVDAAETQRPPAGASAGEVVRVVDGDTLDVIVDGDEYRVRLILVDTPEVLGEPECFGREASAFMEGLVGVGSTVFLEKDVSETDRFDRLLRYVYLSDGNLINELLVFEGVAIVAMYPPDLMHLDRLRLAEDRARATSRGLWGACRGAVAAVASNTPSPSPTATPTPTITPRPTFTPRPAPTSTPPPALVIAAFCNSGGGGETLEQCQAQGLLALSASGGTLAYATVRNWANAYYRLDGGSLLRRSEFLDAFRQLNAGPHSLQVAEEREGTIILSDPWPFTIAVPVLTYEQQKCAEYRQQYAALVGAGAAADFLNWLYGEVERWC